MRLLHTANHKVEEFGAREIPLYAILSHTWEGNEVTFQDIQGANIKRRSDLKRSRTPVIEPRAMGLIMSGSTHAVLIRPAAQSSPKQSTLCTVGTKNLEYAMHILPMCLRPMTKNPRLEVLDFQRANGLLEDGPFRNLSLLQWS